MHEGGLSTPRGVCVYFSYGIPETVGWVHHGESFYIGEIKITGGAMPCPACSQVNGQRSEISSATSHTDVILILVNFTEFGTLR